MAYTAGFTAVANTPLSAAQWNQYVRDNFAETAPAKATAAGRIFVSTGVNAIAEREVTTAAIVTSETTTSTGYTNLTTIGPTVTVVTGPRALVLFTAALANTTSSDAACVSVEVTGASTVAASDAWMLHMRGTTSVNTQGATCHKLFTGLTPGSNTFRMRYRAQGGTAAFVNRELSVIAL